MRYSKRNRYGYNPTYMPQSRGRRVRFRPTPLAILLGAVLLAGIGLGVAALAGAFSGPPSGGGVTNPVVSHDGRFARGTTVDGVDAGGMSWEEAKLKVVAAQQAQVAAVSVTLSNGNYKVQFTSEHIKVSFDTDETLEKALKDGAGEYTTRLLADPSAIEQDVRTYADSLYVQAFDAMVTGFDRTKPDGQRFTFSDDRPGQRVDGDALWAQVKQAFEANAWGQIDVTPEPMPARVTKADLEANSKLVVSYQSKMGDHSKERLHNITLSAEAVSKHLVMPGEEFSFNDATGERTAEKGYQIAHVLNAGVEDNGLAGGVCQVSGTLFNAAARADLEIVKRHPHSIPSSYLIRGQDATVDYPRKDLVIRNNGDTPVIFVITVDQQSPWKVTAEVYGKPFAAGETIELATVVDKVLPKLDTIRYEDSEAVLPGELKEIKPRDGAVISVYKLYKKDGVEYKREKLDSVTYQPYGTVILYHPDDPKPTGLPSASPSAMASATPAPNTPAPNTPAPTPTPDPTTDPPAETTDPDTP